MDRGLPFDVVVGEEVTTRGGHLLALFIEESLEELLTSTVPRSILMDGPLPLPGPRTTDDVLDELRAELAPFRITRSPRRFVQGIIPHSNILLTIGAETLAKNAWRICGSLRRMPITRCSSADFGWPCYEGNGVLPFFGGVGLDLCTSLSLVPYFLAAAYAVKLATSGESYESDSSMRTKQLVVSAVASLSQSTPCGQRP